MSGGTGFTAVIRIDSDLIVTITRQTQHYGDSENGGWIFAGKHT